jgi:dihydrofolate reductase
MRKLIAGVFLYSLDGLLADEGTQYWQFCFGLPVDPADLKQKLGVYQSAYAHIMGRTAYEAMAGALPTAAHPFTGIMNAARKVVFSQTLTTAEWANTTIAAGDTTEEIDMLSRGGDGHTVVWGGVSVWRSLRLDLTDEFRRDLHPYVAGEGTRLFDDPPGLPARPGLLHGVQQRDRRAAVPPAPLARLVPLGLLLIRRGVTFSPGLHQQRIRSQSLRSILFGGSRNLGARWPLSSLESSHATMNVMALLSRCGLRRAREIA